MQTLIDAYNNPKEMLKDLQNLYIPCPTQPVYRNYTGTNNENLDEDFTIAELKIAIKKCTGHKAPGPDHITTAHLRNLAESDMEVLLREINHIWRGSPLYTKWKLGHMVFIPKPGKPLKLSNLRPITLTSNVGKVMERMALRRLQQHLEDQSVLPPNMIGFRSSLSTQDALLQIYEDVHKEPSLAQLKAILAIDLKKAFDHIDHDAMLEELGNTNCGERMYGYVKTFLQDRQLTIGIGDHLTAPFSHPQRGIPQGSVLSPTLFNLAMLKVHRELSKLPDISKLPEILHLRR